MSDNQGEWTKISLICEIVFLTQSNPIGRTALMKLLYFLKVLKRVPVDYNFRFYTYGPFDSSVLEDLNYAEALNAVKSTLTQFHTGYGYTLEAGHESDEVKMLSPDFLKRYSDEIGSIIKDFASKSAKELELLSTLVFIDRDCHESDIDLNIKTLAKKLCEVKPRSDMNSALRGAEELLNSGYLNSVH